MLSINGTNGIEVFTALSTDDRLNEKERAAASRILGDLTIQAEYDDMWRDTDPAEATEPPNLQHRNYRLIGYGRDYVKFRAGGVTFRCHPHTTGSTVNVGIV